MTTKGINDMENIVDSSNDFEIRVKSLNQRGGVNQKDYENEVFTAFVGGIEPVQIKKMIDKTVFSKEIRDVLNNQLQVLINWRNKKVREDTK